VLTLAGVSAHELRLSKDVSFHRGQQLFLGGARGEVELRIQSVKLEVVSVNAAWRTRPAIAGMIRTANALSHSIPQRGIA